MSDTAPRPANSGAQMLADALLRSVGGASARLRVSVTNNNAAMSELGLLATAFAEVVLSPVAMRKLRPGWKSDAGSQWELLVSATSVQQQAAALEVTAAQALFAMTMAVQVGGQDYVIESVASNEAFGQVYLYRLLLREAHAQGV